MTDIDHRGPTMAPARDIAFEGPPCPRCMGLSISGHLWPEMVMPLPQGDGIAPLARDGSGACCFDCAAADGLWRAVLRSPSKHDALFRADRYDLTWFIMARVAVGNDRCEQMRLPGAAMGLAYHGLIAPSQPGDLDAHMAWLEPMLARDEDDLED